MSRRESRIIPNRTDDFFNIFQPLVEEKNYKAGELIFEEGSTADRFFIIKNGEVEIRKITDRTEGRYKPISVLARGEFFGEMAVFLGQPRSADAVAKTDAVIAAVNKNDFALLLRESPDKAFRAMEFLTTVLMERLNSTTNELATVYETGRLVTSVHSVCELSDLVTGSVLKSVKSAEACLFVLWNRFNNEFEVYRQTGFDNAAEISLPMDDRLILWLMENREPFLSFDLQADYRLPISSGSIYSGNSMVASPFFLQGRLLGFIMLLSRTEKNAFSYSQMILLSAISGYVSVALENLQYMQDEIDRGRLNQAKSAIPF